MRIARVALIVLAVGCSMNRPTAEAAAVRAARIAQNRANAQGDFDAVASYWTEDVQLRRALGQAVAGRDAYRKLLADNGSKVVYQRQPVDVAVSARWPLAFESGTWIGRKGSVDGPELVAGRYSAQWVKRDGRWLIRAEVFVALTCAGEGCQFAAVP